MNQNTFGLTLTMSDALGRPIMIATPQDSGSICRQRISGDLTDTPDVAPGATPIAWGNWNATYMVVNRKAVTCMQQDPYSAGFVCYLSSNLA